MVRCAMVRWGMGDGCGVGSVHFVHCVHPRSRLVLTRRAMRYIQSGGPNRTGGCDARVRHVSARFENNAAMCGEDDESWIYLCALAQWVRRGSGCCREGSCAVHV